MLREALDFPTSGERGSAALLVGSALLLFSGLVVVVGAQLPILSAVPDSAVVVPLALGIVLQLGVRGYYVRVLRVTAAELDPVAPSFGDVRGLFRDGLAAVAIAFVYLLPTLLLFAIAAGGNLAGAVENPFQLRDPTSIAAAETVGSLAALLGLFTALASLYLVPGAVTLYAYERRVRSAFDLRTVVRGTASEDYAVGWVVSLVLQALLLPIVLFLYALLVGVVLHFLLGVAVRYMWGSSFGAAMGFDPETVDTEGITPGSGLGRATVGEQGRVDADPLPTDEPAVVDSTADPAVERVEERIADTPADTTSPPADGETTDSPTEPSPSDPMADESNR